MLFVIFTKVTDFGEEQRGLASRMFQLLGLQGNCENSPGAKALGP